MNMMGGGGRQPACYWTGLTLTNFPKRPRSRNSITPVILANSVSSLPSPTFSPGLMRVPRWRTIIDPPETSWPPKAFTPSRCELESRPFFELPKPFLCAMIQLLGDNLADRDAREVLAMADSPLVLLLAFELEDQRLFAASLRGDDAAHPGVSGLRAGAHGATRYCFPPVSTTAYIAWTLCVLIFLAVRVKRHHAGGRNLEISGYYSGRCGGKALTAVPAWPRAVRRNRRRRR